ncbi:MAG TPA: ABC transporter permease [Anaerolineae bacterium]|jgi:ABC-2 type transport system permease protein|nr:ABC transporter permease [Anaerolineae bacterium]
MHLLRSYSLLVRWQALRLKSFLPLAIVVQVLFALGIVAGYPLLFPQIDELTILFLATGAPSIALITMGLVALPQVVSQAKLQGTLDYMRSLPVPRMVYLLADLTVWLLIVLPGVAFAVALGAWVFDLALSVSLAIIPAVLLVATTAAAVGYAMASLLPPMIAMLLTQVLVVGVLMFSPINFPAERLPEWLQSVHAVLPVQAMGEVIRGSLATDTFPLATGSFVLLMGWCAVSLGLSYLALRRRA